MTPLFSVSVICKDEETSIPNLHASLKNYIDAGGELVFIDTGSTDKTIEVLDKLGYVNSNITKYRLRYIKVGSEFVIDLSKELGKINDEFIHPDDTPFSESNTKLTVFDFCAARRYAGKCCSKQWVLSVDCDEVFSALDIEAINAVILSKEYSQLSFTFRYHDNNGNISSVTSRDKLYNKNEADWKWLVHEQVKPLEGYVQKLANLPENVLAINHHQHVAEHRSNYLLSMCVDVMKDPNDQHVFWLGREFHFKGYHQSAIRLLERYLKDYPDAWSAEKCMAAVYIGDAYIDISKATEDNTLRKISERYALMNYFLGTLYEKTFREPWLRIGLVKLSII
jgi:glycosyltransferase involved in cell wall biosynthesis